MSGTMSVEQHTVHSPLNWFVGRDARKACLLVLNSKFYGLENVVEHYWKKFSVCACADGGSNLLYDALENREMFIPQFVCGDLDSAREEVCEFYGNKGTKIVQMPDQDETDFTKTMQLLLSEHKSGNVEFSSVYAMNAMWGRFDQTLGNINTLYSLQEELDDASVYLHLVSEDSIAFLLKPGSHIICVDSGLEEGHCGLIPFGQACKDCTTTGLQWNLVNQSMEVGGLISTCNMIQPGAKEVTVNTSHTLLWTMSHKLLHDAHLIAI